jgi:hypothetical protein
LLPVNIYCSEVENAPSKSKNSKTAKKAKETAKTSKAIKQDKKEKNSRKTKKNEPVKKSLHSTSKKTIQKKAKHRVSAASDILNRVIPVATDIATHSQLVSAPKKKRSFFKSFLADIVQSVIKEELTKQVQQ